MSIHSNLPGFPIMSHTNSIHIITLYLVENDTHYLPFYKKIIQLSVTDVSHMLAAWP